MLKIALEAGAMKLGRVALDGTKVKANATKHKAMIYKLKRRILGGAIRLNISRDTLLKGL